MKWAGAPRFLLVDPHRSHLARQFIEQLGAQGATVLVVLSRKIFTKCLQEASSGSSPGPGGCTNEMLRVCLDDGELFQLLYFAAQDFADGSAPTEVCQALTRATMTALRKTDGGVRGIATGTSFRRFGGEIIGTAVWPGGGASVFSISVRLVHTGRSGLCGACSADWHWSIRPRAP